MPPLSISIYTPLLSRIATMIIKWILEKDFELQAQPSSSPNVICHAGLAFLLE